MADVVVVGGGVIGLSIAYELSAHGVSVTVLEQSQFGQEASWAGAGILPPGNPDRACTPEARLRAHSHVLWPTLTAQLLEETGIDNGYFNCGGIETRIGGDSTQLSGLIEAWRDEGVEIEELDSASLFEREPELNRSTVSAFRIPDKCQVRNPRHLKALVCGVAGRGVELRTGCAVTGFEIHNGKVQAAQTVLGRIEAGQFVVAGGAWSRSVLRDVGTPVAIEPVRGQIVQLTARPLPFRHVIAVGPRYLVPRPDGRILVGSTEEWVGFDKRNTADGVGELIRFATELVPALRDARFERSWSGLRPGSYDGLPYLDRAPNTENLFVAAGHFRSGLQMSPMTAVLMRQLLLGQQPTIPLDAFACNRQRSEAATTQ